MTGYSKRLMMIKQRWINSLPTIIVSIFLFFSILKLFGIVHVIMTSFLTLVFRIRHTQDFNFRELLRSYLLMILVCFFSFLATINIELCIICNLCVPFFLVYMMTNKFTPKSYFVYTMEFVFLQLIPISFSSFLMRFVALIYGFIVVTFSLYIHKYIMKRKRHFGTVRKGMKNLSAQLDKMLRNESFSAEKEELVQMMYHMNQVIYSTRNYSYLANGYGKINYWFMIVFQRFHYYMNNFISGDISDNDKVYYNNLKDIFSFMETRINLEDNSFLIERINYFKKNYYLSDLKSEQAMNSILGLLTYALSDLRYVSINKSEEKWKLPKKVFSIQGFRNFLRIDLFQLRFALRLSIVLCISFLFCRVTKLNHGYWYPMSAFLMLMPNSEESLLKINNRILGTIAGSCITLVLGHVFHGLNQYMIIILLMTCLMYYAPVTSWTMPMYATCYGMALAMTSLKVELVIELRLIYVILAGITTILANRYLLPNTIKVEFYKNINSLFDLDVELIDEIQKSGREECDFNIFRDLIINSRLLSEEIEVYMKNNLNNQDNEFYSRLIPIQYSFIEEIEQLNSYIYMHQEQLDLEDNMILQEIFKNLKDSIKRIRFSYTHNELNSFMQTDKNFRAFGQLDDHLYLNTIFFNCMETIENLEKISSEIKMQNIMK